MRYNLDDFSMTNEANINHAREVTRITWIGSFVNVFLSCFKITAGIVGSSQAVLADGVHSFSDLVTDIAILIGVRYWSAPPDANHPHGHGRIETLITLFIGVVLAGVALALAYNALSTIHEHHTTPPKLIAFIAALISIVSKEYLYQWQIKIGRRIKSPAVIANSWHHRSDGFSSIPAALAVLGAIALPGWYFLDHVGAIVVTIFILQAAWKITVPALHELTDSGAPDEICKKIRELSLSVDGVREIHKIRTRKLGAGFQVDLHVLVEPNLSVREGHDIATAVKNRLLDDELEVMDVITHLEPYTIEETSNQD